jgi:hypothetical protein
MRSPEGDISVDDKASGAPRFDWRAITPGDSPKTPIDLAADAQAVDLSTPKLAEGDMAADFDLAIYDFADGDAQITGRRFRLIDPARKRPVALIFGSYT